MKEMSGRQRLPAGEPRKANQRRSVRAVPAQVSISRVWGTSAPTVIQETGFAPDSPRERTGFEPSVRVRKSGRCQVPAIRPGSVEH